jgi:hypothetical protein
MGWFKKKPSEAEAIAAFWAWWGGVRDDVATAIGDGSVERFTKQFSERVDAIHKDMQWELTPGTKAAHCLVVTPGGNPELRAAAARWLAQAPAADASWEYQAVRRADPSVFESTMVMNGHRLDMDKVRYGISVDSDRTVLDVQCYHPDFAGLPQGMPEQVTMLTLDWALGEDDVEIWIGEIGWTATEPPTPKTPRDLQHAVAAIADDDDKWILLGGQRPDGAALSAVVASPLRSARWPRFDTHVPVMLAYRKANESGLPIDESLQALRDFEDAVTAAIGGNGTLVAHESSDGLRTLHFYVDSQTNAEAQIAETLPGWREGRASTQPARDPAFAKVRHLMP